MRTIPSRYRMTVVVSRLILRKKPDFRRLRLYLRSCMQAVNSAVAGYKVSGGLHGVGASVVNALSEWLEVEICRDGKVYKQRYERGKTMYPLKVVGECAPDKHGTRVVFLPDKEIFEETVYDYDTLKVRLRETAFLTKNLKITLRDDREVKHEKTFHYEGGIKEFVTYLNKGKTPLYPDVIYCEGNKDGIYVEVAMQHNDAYNEGAYSFVNNINTPEGGTHLNRNLRMPSQKPLTPMQKPTS
mgnify:CR=1 FL=1